VLDSTADNMATEQPVAMPPADASATAWSPAGADTGSAGQDLLSAGDVVDVLAVPALEVPLKR